METWEAKYEVVTPLFMCGPNSKPELRSPSLKGILRFWYRAVALPFFKKWQEVKQAEDELFGCASEALGKARVLLDISPVEGLNIVPAGQRWRNEKFGFAYLGFGLINKGTVTRPYLSPGSFSLMLNVRKVVRREVLTPLPWALKAMGLLGGIGARSRRGFGSLTLKSLCHNGEEIWEAPRTIQELKSSIRDFLSGIGQLPEGLPEYTAFGSKTRVSIISTGGDALHLLDEVGKELLRYRSYGRSEGGKHILPWNEIAEQNFADDHHLMMQSVQGQVPHRIPRRVVFGLPHNYFFLSLRKKANVSAKEHKRRASPLFIHIHGLGQNQNAAVLTMLPAVFLPERDRIFISSGKKVELPPNVDYQDISNFLDRKNFRDRVEVWP